MNLPEILKAAHAEPARGCRTGRMLDAEGAELNPEQREAVGMPSRIRSR